MKTTIISILISTLICFQTYGQLLEENKIDEFTNANIKRSSWETFNMSMSFSGYFRISHINEIYYFDLKMMLNGKVFSIGKDDEIMFKLSNGEFVKLKNSEYAISCTGCGAIGYMGSAGQGIKVSYIIEKESLEKLKQNTIVKIRIYTTDSYVENETKEKNSNKINTAIKLVE